MSELATIATYSVFIASYIVFALGKFPGMKIDRPGAAIIGAVLMFATGAVRRNTALYLIHFGTVVLLFSMMLVVAYLHLAGFFDWVTDLVVTRLKPHHLLPTVIFISGFLSAFFVNDIICLVMVPFVLNVSDRMGVKSIPYLLAVATASNIGSTATITGNPQNILSGSFSEIFFGTWARLGSWACSLTGLYSGGFISAGAFTMSKPKLVGVPQRSITEHWLRPPLWPRWFWQDSWPVSLLLWWPQWARRPC